MFITQVDQPCPIVPVMRSRLLLIKDLVIHHQHGPKYPSVIPIEPY